MKITKFYPEFQTILDKHSHFNKVSKDRPLTMNEICFLLREEEKDYNISFPKSSNCWGPIPSVKHTFIPISDLQLKVKEIIFDEESTNEVAEWKDNMLCVTIKMYNYEEE